MKSKVFSVLFFVIAGLFATSALACAVIGAINGEIPLWLAIVLAITEIALFVMGAVKYKTDAKKVTEVVELEKKKEKEIEKAVEAEKEAAPVAVKKTTTRKTTKKTEVAHNSVTKKSE